MRRLLPIALAAALLCGCADNSAEESSGRLTPDSVFKGGGSKEYTLMEIPSQQLVDNIRFGWNLGNALDCCITENTPEDITPDEVTETLWGNPAASLRLFESLVDNGINAVRIPVTWRDHVDSEGNIEQGWLNRVKQVVDYGYDNGMYVIITMYHDGAEDVQHGAWLRRAEKDYKGVISRYNKLWRQIAAVFEDYNERILFESMNEVEFTGVSEDKAYELLNRINREFVNTIRSGGGNNPRRHLLIAGYNAEIVATCDKRFEMPPDPAERCILTVHYYIPKIYCKQTIQKVWGSIPDQNWMDSRIAMLKENFVDKGIPVIIGEYGAVGEDFPSKVYFCERLTRLCKSYGIAAFLWDGGNEVDRENFNWNIPQLVKALRKAAGDRDYTPEKRIVE